MAGESVLRERIALRTAHRRDPSDADVGVLSLQLRVREPLQPDEDAGAVYFDTDFAGSELPDRVDALLRHLGCTPLARAGA
jgi:predicted kinase